MRFWLGYYTNGMEIFENYILVKFLQFTPDDSWNHMQRTKVEEDSQRATTPAYRAPEICDLYSNYPIDKRQDMWALGCLLVLLTTGKHPFEMGEKLGRIFSVTL